MTAGKGTLRDWLQASRLPSQSYIALPLLLGQLVALRAQGGDIPYGLLLCVQLFGVFDQLFIVYANDWADQETDRRNQTATPFSGGSRVLVEGCISPRALGGAALFCAAAMLAVSVGLAVVQGAPGLVPLAFAALGLLWAYSYPPVRLSYRGGGELLQMVGVAGVLPLYGYLAQGGDLGRFPWPLTVALLPTHLACAIATALPDEPSDRDSHKRTVPVRLGGEQAVWIIAALNGLSLALAPWGLASLGMTAGWALAVPAAATLAVLGLRPAPPGSLLIQARVAACITATLAVVAIPLLGLTAR
ncbi:1,4-dihydroxy-2-naphthoate octaprenyltransferase [Stigmatella aurantiaca]|uniref:1,4-dihydroxy-2-naphthoate octaprenyltransferase n=1 Tax=Stigmatella aurantiaca TaxID=41 RepID=A0A1H7US08_STIAU|nr:prenyltransferase [Stigmatella aurantiaca]SEL99614.1 1,4-dihydroxy-2-naphthoate octaprenyltransferase [Stigmatella aurantiaca]